MERHPHGQDLLVDADAPIASYAGELAADAPLRETKLRYPVPYRGYRELLQSWAALDNAQAQMIGRSHQGEPLWMVEIGNPEASKVSVVIAGIHPIEWIGTETALALAQSHAQEPCSDRRVCFFPLTNPDGFRKVEEHLRNDRRKWVRSNHAGVDLNRNWPTHFKKSRGLLAGHNNSGPSPCSEPEVAAVVGMLDTIVEQGSSIDIALSLHSIGKMILMPWGGIWKAPEARQQHLEAAEELRARLGGYTIRQVSHWVPGISFAHGMEIDHFHMRYGATSLLVECTRGELSWRSPSVLLSPFRIFNPKNGREEAARLSGALDVFVRGQLA